MAPATNRINKKHSKSAGALNNGETPIADEDLPDENPFEAKSNLANSPAISRKQKVEENQKVGHGMIHQFSDSNHELIKI